MTTKRRFVYMEFIFKALERPQHCKTFQSYKSTKKIEKLTVCAVAMETIFLHVHVNSGWDKKKSESHVAIFFVVTLKSDPHKERHSSTVCAVAMETFFLHVQKKHDNLVLFVLCRRHALFLETKYVTVINLLLAIS